jgi:hypothetical protein
MLRRPPLLLKVYQATPAPDSPRIYQALTVRVFRPDLCGPTWQQSLECQSCIQGPANEGELDALLAAHIDVYVLQHRLSSIGSSVTQSFDTKYCSYM